MSETLKNKYIKEIEAMVQKAEWNVAFTKFTLKEHMQDESAEERNKVRLNIDQQEQALETNKRFLSWLKNQK